MSKTASAQIEWLTPEVYLARQQERKLQTFDTLYLDISAERLTQVLGEHHAGHADYEDYFVRSWFGEHKGELFAVHIDGWSVYDSVQTSEVIDPKTRGVRPTLERLRALDALPSELFRHLAQVFVVDPLPDETNPALGTGIFGPDRYGLPRLLGRFRTAEEANSLCDFLCERVGEKRFRVADAGRAELERWRIIRESDDDAQHILDEFAQLEDAKREAIERSRSQPGIFRVESSRYFGMKHVAQRGIAIDQEGHWSIFKELVRMALAQATQGNG
jgi:hypothetical protein